MRQKELHIWAVAVVGFSAWTLYCWSIRLPEHANHAYFLFWKLVINMLVLLHSLITYISACYPHFSCLDSISSYSILPVSTPFEPLYFAVNLVHIFSSSQLQMACHTATDCFGEFSTGTSTMNCKSCRPIPKSTLLHDLHWVEIYAPHVELS